MKEPVISMARSKETEKKLEHEGNIFPMLFSLWFQITSHSAISIVVIMPVTPFRIRKEKRIVGIREKMHDTYILAKKDKA